MLFTCQHADYQTHTYSYYSSNWTEVKVGDWVPVCQRRPADGSRETRSEILLIPSKEQLSSRFLMSTHQCAKKNYKCSSRALKKVTLWIFSISYTYLLLISTGAVVVELCNVGTWVEVQLKLSVIVKLQPSVVSDRGRLISGGGGYIWAPMATQRDTASPNTTPDKAPWKTF